MATIQIEATMGNLGSVSDFIDLFLTISSATSTSLTLVDSSGTGFTFTGSGLSYDSSGVTGGSFTGLTIFNSSHAVLETVTDFSIDAQTLAGIYASSGIEGALTTLLAGNDHVNGSSVGDNLVGGPGADTIKGGGGGDVIWGGAGRDREKGGAGADVFEFKAGDGHDRILDFKDTGGPADDVIRITQEMFFKMAIVGDLGGVTLDFGTDELRLDNVSFGSIDLSDFQFI